MSWINPLLNKPGPGAEMDTGKVHVGGGCNFAMGEGGALLSEGFLT